MTKTLCFLVICLSVLTFDVSKASGSYDEDDQRAVRLTSPPFPICGRKDVDNTLFAISHLTLTFIVCHATTTFVHPSLQDYETPYYEILKVFSYAPTLYQACAAAEYFSQISFVDAYVIKPLQRSGEALARMSHMLGEDEMEQVD